jgi:hypothetical protein
MKKVFIGLLIIAAGAVAYYLLQKKKPETDKPVDKELLTGKWKLNPFSFCPKDSGSKFIKRIIPLKDSAFQTSRYDFQKGGTLVQAISDSFKADTSYYEWGKKNELLIKGSIKDSTGEIYSVNKLNTDSLILQSKDSAIFVLTKLK